MPNRNRNSRSNVVRRNRKRRNISGRRRSTRSVLHPQPIQSTFVFSKVLRFQSSTSLSNVLITQQDLFDLLCYATSPTAAYQLVSGIKLLSVEMWGPMSSSLTPVTVSLEYPQFSSSLGGITKVHSDVSMGSMASAHLRHAPEVGSAQSFWQTFGSAASEFILNGPSGTIVDVSLSFVVRNGETVQAVGGIVAGATTGQTYLRALDSNGSSLLAPVSYVTI